MSEPNERDVEIARLIDVDKLYRLAQVAEVIALYRIEVFGQFRQRAAAEVCVLCRQGVPIALHPARHVPSGVTKRPKVRICSAAKIRALLPPGEKQ